MISTILLCLSAIAMITIIVGIVLYKTKFSKKASFAFHGCKWLVSLVGILSPLSFLAVLLILSEGGSFSAAGSIVSVERAIPKEMIIQMVGPNAAVINALGVLSTVTFTASFSFVIVVAMSFLLLIRIARKDSNSENIQFSFDSYQDSKNIKFDNFTGVTRLNI